MKGGKSKVAASKKAGAKLGAKRKISEKASSKPAKREKDDNDSKRPASAFFVFIFPFYFERKAGVQCSVQTVTKAAGDKWKSLSDADEDPHQEKEPKLMVEYTKDQSTNKQNRLSCLSLNKVSDGDGGYGFPNP